MIGVTRERTILAGSALQRIAGVVLVLAVLWVAVLWAVALS